MLQINCPKCESVIHSSYLNDLESIECGQCKEIVTVENVFVTTKGFSMHREDLLKRIFRYQRLLGEVEKERILLEKDSTSSEKTRQSVEDFYLTLQELLAGARGHFRLDVPYDLYVQMESKKGSKSRGKLINLSLDGALIKCERGKTPLKTKSKIELQLALPLDPQPLSVLAEVAWVRKPPKDSDDQHYNIGVKFTDLDEDTRASFWNYITDTETEMEPKSNTDRTS